jgi:hypothetical protein
MSQPSLELAKNDSGNQLSLDGNQMDTASALANMQAQAAYTQDNLKSYGVALDVLKTAPKDWPQNQIQPGFKTRGMLPSILLQPTLETTGGKKKVEPGYEYEDWRGQKLKYEGDNITSLKTEDRYKLTKDFPINPDDLDETPYSMRDIPLIFGDSRMDYFRHGLQTIDNLTPIENPINGNSTLRLDQFKATPFENNDPVMYGFEIIIDSVSSPLLNGSILDFINQYTSINEIAVKKQVYEDFKNQFVKFFRTNGGVKIDSAQTTITRTETKSTGAESNTNIFWPGKKSYLGYYIKKIGGLDNLVETNKGDVYKYLSDWKKDFITLDFLEDVSLSVGTLTHLYKLLYWSRPQGKLMIPENLLRFNCEIIISECRNFNRTRKNLQSGNLEILKDNLSRYIYSLRECQFWFDKMPHPNEVSIGGDGPTVYENYTMQFDYKYATTKLERFVPAGGWGAYVGYNGGSIWKIGNAGGRGGTVSVDSSAPKFFTVGKSDILPNENGVNIPYVLKVYGSNPTPTEQPTDISEIKGTIDTGPNNNAVGAAGTENKSVDNVKKESEKSGKKLADKLAKEFTLGEMSKSSASISKTILAKSGKLQGTMTAVSKSLPLQKILGKSTFTKLGNSFADVRGSLGKAEGFAKGLGVASSTLRQADLRSQQFNYNLSKAGIKMKEFRNKEVEDAQDGTTGNDGTLDDKNKKFSLFNKNKDKDSDVSENKAGEKKRFFRHKEVEDAKDATAGNSGTLDDKTKNSESKFSRFFNVRGDKDKQPEANDTRRGLLNETIGKIFDGKGKKSTDVNTLVQGKSDKPASTEFFDKNGTLDDQISKFTGGSLGDMLGFG